VIVKQETKQKRNETKKKFINKRKNETNIKEMIILHETTNHKWPIEKPLKITGRFGYGRNK
jgi:hypothetical protein